MNINEKEFRELVAKIVIQVLKEQQRAKQRLYIIFEDFFDVRYEEFLRTITAKYHVFAIIPDAWNGSSHIHAIRSACAGSEVLMRKESDGLPLEGSLTVYPAASRSFIAKTALGISDDFETRWAVRCMAHGADIWILQSGLEKFTGKEPRPYVECILKYYRTLLTYGIGIGNWEQREDYTFSVGNTPKETESVSSRKMDIQTEQRLITASDIITVPCDTTVRIVPGTIITALARERAEDKHIRFV